MPAIFWINLVLSVALTAAIYGAGPILFVMCQKKQPTVRALRMFCAAYTLSVWVIVQLLSYDGGQVRTIPAILWGYVFYRIARDISAKKPLPLSKDTRSFKEPEPPVKENNVYEAIMKLISDTVDDVAIKYVDLYTQDDYLQKCASQEKLLDISFECALLLTHVLDVVLANRRQDIRESVIRSVYSVLPVAYSPYRIDLNIPFRSEDVIEDRMQRYGMIARGEWNPSASWCLGAELDEDAIVQCLALYGDYITFFRIHGRIPLGDDIEPITLINPFDCETLAVPHIVAQILAPAVAAFGEKLDAILQDAEDGPEITFSAKKSRGISEEDYRRAMHITSLSLWSKELKEIAQVMGKTPAQTKKYFEEIVRNYNLAKSGGN